ncbi:MAG: transposase [Chlorobaculum sp.]|nr:transposase [Chlorobaculum sp.]
MSGCIDAGLAEYFKLYNTERPHQSLGYKTPYKVYERATGGGGVDSVIHHLPPRAAVDVMRHRNRDRNRILRCNGESGVFQNSQSIAQ